MENSKQIWQGSVLDDQAFEANVKRKSTQIGNHACCVASNLSASASRSRNNVSKVLGVLQSENLDDFGPVESEDSDCNDVDRKLPSRGPA